MATGIANLLPHNVARPLRVIVVLSLIVGGLWVVDWSLERAELNDLQREAQEHFQEGSRLLQDGKLEPAIDLLRRAHSLERKNTDYELVLIQALIAAGKTGDAQSLLDDVLQRQPNDARANLTAARLMAMKGLIAEPEAYYHRAIYGQWPSSGAPRSARRSARMELIEFLVKHGQNDELLPELLLLQEEADEDLGLKKRIARLLTTAGSPARAADLYHSLIEQNRNDPELYSGLGETELMRGQYHAAVAAFVTAYRHKPGDAGILKRLEFASLMAGLDPTPRQLRSVDKYQRSLRILELASTAYDRCLVSKGRTPQADEPSSSTKLPAHVTNELAEAKLAQAEKNWRLRISECGHSTSPDEEPLRLIMAKLAQ